VVAWGWNEYGQSTVPADLNLGVTPPAAIGVSPSSLSFVAQNVGTTSAAQTVTLTNTGAFMVAINSIATSGDYAQATTCAVLLTPGASCTASVTFTPAAAGARSGSLTISSNAAGSPHTVSLSNTVTLNLNVGWNLVGNSFTGSLDVATAIGDTTKVITAWKWIANGAKWAFYASSLAGQALADYATGKGYDVLTSINGGEGFWINAKTPFTAQLPVGTAITSASFQTMLSGWNLIAIGESKTPSQFNALASAAAPLTTLWAWDPVQTNWYFYAPSLDASGGLSAYIADKGYLDFMANNKMLGQGVGFWVNKP
jgi:hypothetical protein